MSRYVSIFADVEAILDAICARALADGGVRRGSLRQLRERTGWSRRHARHVLDIGQRAGLFRYAIYRGNVLDVAVPPATLPPPPPSPPPSPPPPPRPAAPPSAPIEPASRTGPPASLERSGSRPKPSAPSPPPDEVAAAPARSPAALARIKKPAEFRIVKNAQRGQLLRLLDHRDLRPLPSGFEPARRFLRALLDIGLDKPTARRLVPWLGPDELAHMVDEASVRPRRWTPRDLGNLFEITLEERTQLDIRNIECFDAQRHEVQDVLRDRRRKADAERKRCSRADERGRRQLAADFGDRASAIVTVLTRDRSRTLKELMKALARCPAFRMQDGKRFLTGGSLRKAITRELLKNPKLAALVEIDHETEKHGRERLIVRLK
jgi:hypothetical protein